VTTAHHAPPARRPAGRPGAGDGVRRGRRSIPAGVAVLALGLLALSVLLRTRQLGAGFWVDEGIAVGIAGHALADIPGVLVQDGSPPLYYLLLHLWMDAVGTGEAATRALSLVCAAACVPVALLAGRAVAGLRAGVCAAALAATVPFLTVYAQETRMYALVVLLSLGATAAFVRGFVHRRRRWVPAFAVLLTALLYAHNWGLFLAAAALAATASRLPGRDDRLVRDAALAFGGAALAFVPWVPTLVAQVRETGAPWARPPTPLSALGDLAWVWGTAGSLVLLGGVGVGLWRLRRGGEGRERATAAALAVLVAGTVALPLLASVLSTAWAPRYLAMALGPALLLAGMGLARAGRPGVVAVAALVALAVVAPPDVWPKSNVREVARAAAPLLVGGDLVVSTQPEQVPVLAYELGDDVRYVTPLGPAADPGVTDWRGALARMRGGTAARRLAPELDALPVGGTVLLVVPQPWTGTEWARLVRRRSAEWRAALLADPRFRPLPRARIATTAGAWSTVRGYAFRRVRAGDRG